MLSNETGSKPYICPVYSLADWDFPVWASSMYILMEKGVLVTISSS
jgi:hypothetical protein